MKKIINKPEHVVDEMCRGIALAHGHIENIAKYRILKRKTIDNNKVTLISGGGSGHEPAHAGFVGPGMLDAAVCGDVFASPSQIQIYQAIKTTASDQGTLLIIKNYSGDMMNFQNGAFLAEMDGLRVEYVKVADDIAVMDSLYTVGRRGVAGTIFVHKTAGAAAAAGHDLAEVKRVAQKAADNVRSIGFAYTSCTVPAKGTPTFSLADEEMEYGVGIHGEPGVKRDKVCSANEMASRMVEALARDLQLHGGERVAVLVNGFGATPLQELYILNEAVMRELDKRDVAAGMVLVGNYMTSIDMAGASISLLRLDDELARYLAAPCHTPALTLTGAESPGRYVSPAVAPAADAVNQKADVAGGGNIVSGETISKTNIIYIVDKMAEVIIENEVAFCELDSHAGDGDFGMSVAKGFRQLKREWALLTRDHGSTISAFLDACSLVIMEHCGGASGPIWGFAFKYAAKSADGKASLTVADMARLLQAAVEGIQTVGKRSFGRGAVVGDKTLIDALVPCAESWSNKAAAKAGMRESFDAGAKAAVAGAAKTADFTARMGRAGTVGERSLGYPDAGAHALGVIFSKISQSLEFK